MAGKSLNKKNLEALGAETLAELLMEAVKGDAARQRRVRMALSSEQSPKEAAADIRKRLAQIRRAKSWISTRAQRTLVKELNGLIDIIVNRVASEDVDLGFDLLWSLLQLDPDIHARTDDSNGAIGAVMDAAMDAIQTLAPRFDSDAEQLADQVLTTLRVRAETAMDAPVTVDETEYFGIFTSTERRLEMAKDNKDRTLRMILSDIADAQGDVDAWLSQYSARQLTYHTIAPDAARRLLQAGRAKDALQIMERCIASEQNSDRAFDTPEVDSAHFACLEALGQEDALRSAMWSRFETRLCAETLRRYLSRLPDFDDDEALEDARTHVRTNPDLLQGLIFCMSWPDPGLAADMVLSRQAELDGDSYELLTPTAELLKAEHPLAATLIWRSMISFALQNNRAKRYRHAARHLASCAQADMEITDYATFQSHEAFVDDLRRKHPRKHAFWDKVEQQGRIG
ncbi:hypothetical protein PhaeoP23_03710 (plasmid) [Phaeobacter piscinae]|uniref:HEAT repeat domain-containing protein n=1 Tax=Phaeobacter piscinae TaxID=1580596 RepID=A0ABM6PIR7_9RHOB|nr:DUF6880 family protein [Phaeobacter piscinae]ATG37787.1 hypothetical protein PhaeoP36_03710 [Phaeobacter piscinae]AUQ88308.1 hypothetical protein PhaeoP42_03711 [Phaeobacter piscinae]AUR26191.1 hypothetical protein PhaeoP23_03710 [Phaeobacter piscinae]